METTINIENFCAGENENLVYHFAKPMNSNGFTYATNGKIAIRISAPDKSASDWLNEHQSRAIQAIDGFVHNENAKYMPLGDVGYRAIYKPCHFCGGTGRWGCGPCEECIDGELEETQYIQFPNYMLDHRLLHFVAGLPDVQIGIMEPEWQDPIPFKFTGGIGFLMPLSKEFEPSNPKEYQLTNEQRELMNLRKVTA